MFNDDTVPHLETLDPAIQHAAWYLVAGARRAGWPVIVISSRRDPRRNADAGGDAFSNHLDGMAFDVQLWPFLRDEVPLPYWEVLGRFWEALGGRWGGRFSTPDVNHFDAGKRFEVF